MKPFTFAEMSLLKQYHKYMPVPKIIKKLSWLRGFKRDVEEITNKLTYMRWIE